MGPCWMLLMVLAACGVCHLATATCVLDSDFGFVLNCGFKKSGIFRVRNLGGVKGYVGLGLSVGDEGRFNESLSNTEDVGRRRSSGAARSSDLAPSPPTKWSALGAAPAVPPFKPLPPPRAASNKYQHLLAAPGSTPSHNVSRPSRLAGSGSASSSGAVKVPPFQALPPSITRVADAAFRTSLKAATNHFQVRNDIVDEPPPTLTSSTSTPPPSSPAPPPPSKVNGTAENSTGSAAGTGEVLEEAPGSGAGVGAVMNAPKEYYPVGYDKDFDDGFASKVKLPPTSFRCGEQTHFPGLYADQELGCMVFHVCALTDQGLVMKSFLCPQSTLFDQSVLACNWWFYVDCGASRGLYGSNGPLAKSYGLVKALDYFKGYRQGGGPTWE